MVMSKIRQLETLIEGWMRVAPHLPMNAKKWLADNVWWIVLVVAILSAINVLSVIGGISAYYNFVGNTAGYVGMYAIPTYSAGWIWSSIINLAVVGLSVVLYFKAVTPLKEHRKWGWDLMFIVLLLQAVNVLSNAVFNFSIFGFIFTALFGAAGLAIGAYFLFEVRSYFIKSTKRERAAV
jgi:hypothetical protein